MLRTGSNFLFLSFFTWPPPITSFSAPFWWPVKKKGKKMDVWVHILWPRSGGQSPFTAWTTKWHYVRTHTQGTWWRQLSFLFLRIILSYWNTKYKGLPDDPRNIKKNAAGARSSLSVKRQRRESGQGARSAGTQFLDHCQPWPLLFVS